MVLASNVWSKARDAAKQPAMNRTAPQQRIIMQPGKSTVPRLRNFGLDYVLLG